VIHSIKIIKHDYASHDRKTRDSSKLSAKGKEKSPDATAPGLCWLVIPPRLQYMILKQYQILPFFLNMLYAGVYKRNIK